MAAPPLVLCPAVERLNDLLKRSYTPAASPSPRRLSPITTLPQPPPTTSLTGTTPLDAAWFPHVVDRIVSFCPLPALLAFRATNRRFRDRITPQVYSHCAAEYDPAHPDQGLYARDPLAESPCALAPIPLAPSLPHLTHLRVLDILGALPPAMETLTPDIVRLWPGAKAFPATRRLVLLHEPKFPHTLPPRGVATVVHAAPSLASLVALNAFHCQYQGVVPHVVITFPPGMQLAPPEKPASRAFTFAMFVILLLSAAMRATAPRSVTIVGLDALAPADLGLSPACPCGGDCVEECERREGEAESPAVRAFRAFFGHEAPRRVSEAMLGADRGRLDSVVYLPWEKYVRGMSEDEVLAETVV